MRRGATWWARRPPVMAPVALLLALTACGGQASGVTPTAPGRIAVLAASHVPATIGGLEVKREDVGQTVAAAGPAYVDAVAMYGLRAGSVLEATLEVGRFAPGSRYRSARFQAGIVNRIGSTTPRRYRLGHDVVYLTTGTRQYLAVWFRGRLLMILTVRQDYRTARALLRDALEVRA